MNYNFKDSTILVTGGAGFIGSNICDELLRLGNRVVCLDNFETGSMANLSSCLMDKNFRLIEGDIRILDDCEKACEGVDYILHHAALGSVPRSINDPITSNDVNVVGFLNMLVAAKNNGVKRFVYAASSSTYGDSKTLPKVEEIIGSPMSPYAVTKYVNELYAGVFSRVYGLETIGLRYFNVFGRKQSPNGTYAAVIPRLVSSLLKGESPIINGDGMHSRDFTYIDNVIQANILSIITTNPQAINTVYNIACGQRITLNELIKYLKDFLSEYDPGVAEISIKYGPERLGDIPHSHANIDKAKYLLKYDPKYSVESGLRESVKWYYQNL